MARLFVRFGPAASHDEENDHVRRAGTFSMKRFKERRVFCKKERKKKGKGRGAQVILGCCEAIFGARLASYDEHTKKLMKSKKINGKKRKNGFGAYNFHRTDTARTHARTHGTHGAHGTHVRTRLFRDETTVKKWPRFHFMARLMCNYSGQQ